MLKCLICGNRPLEHIDLSSLAHQVIDRTYWYDEESGDNAWEWYEDYDEEEDLATQVSDQELQGTV